MPRIPFIEARFFEPTENRHTLEQRFRLHLQKLREAKGDEAYDLSEILGPEPESLCSSPLVSTEDVRKISRRTKRLLDRRDASSGLAHLKAEDRERLQALRNGVELIRIPNEHRADELAAELHAGMPWLAPATDIVWQAMRRSVREGWTGLRLPPLLLDGSPGLGKSFWARRLGACLSAPTTVIEATGENTSFSVVGSQRGWSSAHPGRVLETALASRIGNPVIVVDEVEKAGDATSSKGQSFNLADSLLPLLEPVTARNWSCPYFQVRFDMSWIIWVLTSNDFRRLPAPLLSRCPPIALRDITAADLTEFARREGASRHLSPAAIDATCAAIDRFGHRSDRLSLRSVTRLLDHAVKLAHQPQFH
ncbi:AAA family ATPase [uncultured Paracoccus sp.]|uniref:AAA family ATPase n=1 Tax=uncultured Paracoccus sp. TaxID=189685 RepID=UPI00261F7964|nr:AAA family ATPase [uncultured Paracoccus sp.]